jgi:hypothetical protein
MTDKIIAYLKALLFISTTVLWFVVIDYDKLLESTLNLTVFCLISGNLVLWSFYYIYKFCKVMKDVMGIKEIKEND